MEQNKLAIPIAIIIAGAIIAGAVFYSNKGKVADKNTGTVTEENVELAPISDKDHIFGNPNAPIVFVEYSDTECPFCKKFHETMNQVMSEYGKDGKVAWVYRQFPIDQLHSKARKESQATECAGEVGGNDKFWAYLNKLFSITPSNNNLDLSLLPTIATDVGLDKAKFEECLASDRWNDKVEADYQSGVKAGVRGTPHTIMVVKKDGSMFPISGAQPYATVKAAIEEALK